MADKFLNLNGLAAIRDWVSSLLTGKVNTTDYATDDDYGLVKTNSAESVTLDADGKLNIGGRLGQDPVTTGIFSPKSIVPRNVNDYSMMVTEANGLDFATTKSFGVVTGANITLKSQAAAGATQYIVTNNYANRLVCAALVGGYVALNEDWAKANQVVKVLSVQINGADYTPDSSANSSTANIVITTEESANPDAATSTIRGYGAFAGYSNLAVGQNVNIGSSNTGASAVIGANCKTSGNWAFVTGQGNFNDAARSAVFGTNNINRKQNAFLAGQGHDSTNAPTPTSAVGKFSDIGSKTAFAVGIGTSHTARKNAFEVLTDGRAKISGTPTEADDVATKQYVDSQSSGGGVAVTTYGNADFTYEKVVDPDTGKVTNECVAYSTVAGNVEEPKAVKYGRVVNMAGAFKNINVRPNNGTFVMGKVPSGCEPLYRQSIMQQGSTQYKYLLTIETDGTMKCSRYSGTTTAIAVTNNAWLNINATYISKT